MTHTLTIAAREIRERMFVFFAAGIMALSPFVIALVPQARTAGRNTVIATMGLIVSIGFTFALALVLGGSFVGRDLSERRLSFYFSKPVSAAEIWWGKLSAAVVILAGCLAITFLPSFLVAHGEWRPLWSDSAGGFVEAVLIASVVLLLLVHAGSTMVRSHSPRVVIDLVLLIVISAAVWLTLRPLYGAFQMASRVASVFAVGIFLSLLFCGAWQVSRGRTDIRRSHGEMSKFLWTSIGAVVAIATLYVVWVVSPKPGDIKFNSANQSPRGDWVVLSGVARHRADYHAAFLVNVRTGQSMRFDAARWDGASFTRNGDAAMAILALEPKAAWRGKGELFIQRLDHPRSDASTGIETQSIWPALALSDDLRRVAIIDRGILAVHDFPRKALLASMRLPESTSSRMFFGSPDVVRIYTNERVEADRGLVAVRAYEFDLRTRRLQRTGEIIAPIMNVLDVSADGRTMLITARARIVVADARTLAPRFVIDGGAAPRTAILLAGGGVAAFDNSAVHLFDADGAHIRDIALAAPAWALLRELVPGKKLLAAVWRGGRWDSPDHRGRGWDVCVIDLVKGAVERREQDAVILSQFHSHSDPRHPDVQPVDYVIVDGNAVLWRWNPLTGAKTRVL